MIYTPFASKFLLSGASSTTTGTPYSITVTVQDPYGTTVTNYAGSVTVSSATDSHFTAPSSHTFTGSDNGVYAFTGALFGSIGSESITANDGTVTATKSNITVTHPAPVANSQSLAANFNSATPLTLTASETGSGALTYTVLTSPSHGVLTGSGPNPTYSPNLDYIGSDAFTFKVNDTLEDSNTATVSIDVTVGGCDSLASPFGGGSGTSGSPYLICTAKHFLAIANDSTKWTSHFVLSSNIDLGTLSLSQTPSIGFYGNAFTGVFDGNGHTLSSLQNGTSIGLFGAVSGDGTTTGIIKNLGVLNLNGSAGANQGGIVQTMYGGTLSNCYTTGTLLGSGNGLGGLVGHLISGTIQSSFSAVSINNPSGYWTGGLLGALQGGTVSNSYATGAINCVGQCGGLAGYASSGTISSSYSNGAVTAVLSHGGLVGGTYSPNTASATNALWDITTSGNSTSYFGTGLATISMKSPASYPTPAFSSTVWSIQAGSYPSLKNMPLGISGISSVVISSQAVSLTAYGGDGNYTWSDTCSALTLGSGVTNTFNAPSTQGTTCLITLSDGSSHTTFANTTVSLALGSSIYFCAQNDRHWDTAGNWFTNSSCNTPAHRFPMGADKVYLVGPQAPDTGPDAQLTVALFDSSGLNAGFDSTLGTLTGNLQIASGGTLKVGVSGDNSNTYSQNWFGSNLGGTSVTMVFQGSAVDDSTSSATVYFNDSSYNLGNLNLRPQYQSGNQNTPPTAGSSLFFCDTGSGHWNDLHNWFRSSDCSTISWPTHYAARIPNTGDSVVIQSGIFNDYVNPVTLNSYNGAAPSDGNGYLTSGISIVGGPLAITSGNWGGISGPGSPANFVGSSVNDGFIQGPAIFGGNSNNFGIVEGPINWGPSNPNNPNQCNALAAPFGGGAGTLSSPFMICSAEQMQAIGADSSTWASVFQLEGNIDLSVYTGNSFNLIGGDQGSFTGIFNGNGFVISNLNFEDPNNSYDYGGLFGYVSGDGYTSGIIENLGLVNVTFNTGGGTAGTLVGLLQGGAVMNSYASGRMIGSWEYLGGLIGESQSGYVTSSFATVDLTQTNNYWTGGFIGYADDGGSYIINSYTNGWMQGGWNSQVGPFVGYLGNNNQYVNSYAAEFAMNQQLHFGFGSQSASQGAQNCFYDADTQGTWAEYSGASGLSDSEMQNPSNFLNAGWSPTVWNLANNYYPLLLNMPFGFVGGQSTVAAGSQVGLTAIGGDRNYSWTDSCNALANSNGYTNVFNAPAAGTTCTITLTDGSMHSFSVNMTAQ
jgi:hypothetical protein